MRLYTGPAKPIPTKPSREWHTAGQVASRAIVLIFLIAVIAYDLLIGRPG